MSCSSSSPPLAFKGEGDDEEQKHSAQHNASAYEESQETGAGLRTD